MSRARSQKPAVKWRYYHFCNYFWYHWRKLTEKILYGGFWLISALIFQVPPVGLLRTAKIKLPKCSNTFKNKSTINSIVTPLDFLAANCWTPVFQYSQCILPTNSYWINTLNMESKCTRKADFKHYNTGGPLIGRFWGPRKNRLNRKPSY